MPKNVFKSKTVNVRYFQEPVMKGCVDYTLEDVKAPPPHLPVKNLEIGPTFYRDLHLASVS